MARLPRSSLAILTVLSIAGIAFHYGAKRIRQTPSPQPLAAPGSDRGLSRPHQPTGPCSIQLQDVTAESRITFQHTDGSTGQYYIAETVSSGLALFDYDGDGLTDIYFPNGTPLPGPAAEPAPRHALYKNLGGLRFRDVTQEAGITGHGFGLGATAGDYNNDGHLDLYVSNFGPKVLYQNNGDGTFTDVTVTAGVADGNKLGAGVCCLDYDSDGDLDLFAGSYVDFTYEKHVVHQRDGYPEYASPKDYPPQSQSLFANQADGTFTDVSGPAGISAAPGKGMGAVCADYDRDGDTDIFLLNDVFGNFAFRNDGRGKFDEVSLLSGLKYNGEGMALGSMGVDCGDYDNDGWLDFFQTSYQRERPVLFRNLGTSYFLDVTNQSGAWRGTLNNVKWGCGLVDLDNDGLRDLFVAMGHLQDQIEHYDRSTSFRARNVVLQNVGNGKFVDVSSQAGTGLLPTASSRGAAFDDLDNDGDLDAVVLNTRDRSTVLRNQRQELGASSHWLQVQLRGVTANRDGVGAQVSVICGETRLIDEVHSGRGYQSHFGSRLHFGLGTANRVDRIEVRWIGGGTDVFQGVSVDRVVTLVQHRTESAHGSVKRRGSADVFGQGPVLTANSQRREMRQSPTDP